MSIINDRPVWKLSRFYIWPTHHLTMDKTKWVVTEWDPRKEWRGEQLRWHRRYDNRADAELAAMEMCED